MIAHERIKDIRNTTKQGSKAKLSDMVTYEQENFKNEEDNE